MKVNGKREKSTGLEFTITRTVISIRANEIEGRSVGKGL